MYARDESDPVLVLRALGLGDLLVAVPALRALRRHVPRRRRLVLAAPGELTALALGCGAVDELLPTADLDALRWNRVRPPALAVNLHGSGPQSHRVLDRTRPGARIGCRPAAGPVGGTDPGPDWSGPSWSDLAAGHAHERDRWCALLEAFGVATDPTDLRLPVPPGVAGTGPAVIVHPGAAFGAKRWPGERFATVAAALDRPDAPVVVTGSAAERGLAQRVAAAAGLPERRVLAGRTDVAQLAALVAGAGLVVCGDTGIAHLASAYGIPSVVLFGPVPASRWGPPPGGPHVVLTDDRVRRGDPFADDPDPALLAVTVGDVLSAGRSLRPLVDRIAVSQPGRYRSFPG